MSNEFVYLVDEVPGVENLIDHRERSFRIGLVAVSFVIMFAYRGSATYSLSESCDIHA